MKPNAASIALKEIEKGLQGLTASPLYAFRIENGYQPVVGEGSIDASIMFVGEAPGKTEALSGRPFCGRSGKFLDEMLAHIGLDRAKVYITNVVKDRPPENRDPTPTEIALYAPFLDQQIMAIKPKVIVPLGRISMKYVMERYGLAEQFDVISKLHGKALQGTAPYGPVAVVPLYHPAVALYNGGMRTALLQDFEILKRYI
jgi:uracil-DNA glycosylase family 4